MRIVCISDTHGQHAALDGFMPDGDFLVHAGDLTSSGKLAQTIEAAKWLDAQAARYKHVIAIAGNHDWALQAFMTEKHEDIAKKLFGRAHYLRDEGITLDGVHLYGSPWSPTFFSWAFNADRGLTIKRYWDLIPSYTNVLITHGPPSDILDWVGTRRVGCEELAKAVLRIKPQAHIFGHIHCAAGYKIFNGTQFVNASVLDDNYRPAHAPTVIEI